jgi:branched-chain amino acid transport system ATP-binding protein
MAELLRMENVSAGYGNAVVLEDVSLTLNEGESLALLGRNGVGKSTLVTTVMGLTRVHGGRLFWRGADLRGLPVHRRAHEGIGWVPQERYMFPSLTVEEHLGAVARPGYWDARRVYALFPRLAERRRNLGNQLSGGEQQMLAIARALVLNPRLLLLDEPLEGLAPILVQELLEAIRVTREQAEMTLMLIEQHARLILPLAHSAIVLERGRVAHRAAADALLRDAALLEGLLGVSAGAHVPS